jgi:hypothetical protein
MIFQLGSHDLYGNPWMDLAESQKDFQWINGGRRFLTQQNSPVFPPEYPV